MEDRLPVLFLPGVPSSSPESPLSSRRRPLIAFPHAANLTDEEIPWIGLYQSLDLRMGRILDSLDRLSRGESLRLPVVVPVRISERAITFFSRTSHEEGLSGSVTVELPTLPVREIGCDLRVVRCEAWPGHLPGPPPGPGHAGTAHGSGYAVTGTWVEMGGDARESLVQYLILRQREILSAQGRTNPAR